MSTGVGVGVGLGVRVGVGASRGLGQHPISVIEHGKAWATPDIDADACLHTPKLSNDCLEKAWATPETIIMRCLNIVEGIPGPRPTQLTLTNIWFLCV